MMYIVNDMTRLVLKRRDYAGGMRIHDDPMESDTKICEIRFQIHLTFLLDLPTYLQHRAIS